uniref:Uncharacterized protein n=1 Tax=Anguilla anguilla TaxID=7936 RepID=A0A0E9S0E5_ANGAN
MYKTINMIGSVLLNFT